MKRIIAFLSSLLVLTVITFTPAAQAQVKPAASACCASCCPAGCAPSCCDPDGCGSCCDDGCASCTTCN